jgi:hypothetical protein
MYVGSGIGQKVAVPNGHGPGTAWVIAQKAGGLAAMRLIQGAGQVTGANLAGGLNAESSLTGSGTVTLANLALVASAVATLLGVGGLTAAAKGKLEAAAALVGEGDLAGSVGALADAVAALTGAGTAAGTATAKGSLSADITVTGDLLSTSNVADSVWNALASRFNTPGTMGGSLAAAGAAGDPWSTSLPASYPVGTAGYMIGNLAEQILLHADGIEDDVTLQGALRALLATLTGKATGGGGPTITFRDPGDTTDRVTLTVDEDGNRSNVTLNL